METDIILRNGYTISKKGSNRPPKPMPSVGNHRLIVFVMLSFVVIVVTLNVNNAGNSMSAFETYGYYQGLLLWFISLIPYLSLPVTFMNCAGYMLYNPYKKPKLRPNALSNAPFLCFRTVTRGDYAKLTVKNALANKLKCLEFGLDRFVIEIATDKPVNAPKNDNFIKETVVPSSYESKEKTLFKARALHYCTEPYVDTFPDDIWIVHLDEETLISDESLTGILNFVDRDDADIGQGPINYLGDNDVQNWITTMADCVRLALDYGLFRFQFSSLHIPLFGFKGSYIVIKNKVEKDVGLDLGPKGSIAEDCYFALKAWARGYKFEFIPGEMNEKSPFTVMDYIQQRKRWFVGQMFTVQSAKVPIYYKSGIILSLTCCLLMPISLSNIVLNYIYPFSKPLIFHILTGFIGGTFAFLYAFGAFKATSCRTWTYRKRIIIAMLNCTTITPFSATLESIAAIWGLLTLNSIEFFIVKKEISEKKRNFGHSKLP